MEVTQIGAYTVSSGEMLAMVLTESGRVLKSFTGETAWSDAERYASDLHFADMRS